MGGLNTYLAGLSDHAPLEVTLVFSGNRGANSWRLATKWLQDSTVEEIVSPKLEQYWDLNVNSASAQMVWEAFKTNTRGEYISAIKAVHSEISSQVQQLEGDKSKAAKTFSVSPTSNYFSQLTDARRALSLHLATVTHLALNTLAGRIFLSLGTRIANSW